MLYCIYINMCVEKLKGGYKVFFFDREVDFGLYVFEFLLFVVWKVVIVFWFIFYFNIFREKK